jgi:hypothetical protein
MNIDKDQILQLLRSQRRNDQASSELPQGCRQQAVRQDLSRYGVDPTSLGGKLGGLGKSL